MRRLDLSLDLGMLWHEMVNAPFMKKRKSVPRLPVCSSYWICITRLIPRFCVIFVCAGSVLGFDHAPYDAVVKDYAEHLYPYALWEYRRKVCDNDRF